MKTAGKSQKQQPSCFSSHTKQLKSANQSIIFSSPIILNLPISFALVSLIIILVNLIIL